MVFKKSKKSPETEALKEELAQEIESVDVETDVEAVMRKYDR